jgi:hypothetical protein
VSARPDHRDRCESVESRCGAVAVGSNLSVAASFVWRCLPEGRQPKAWGVSQWRCNNSGYVAGLILPPPLGPPPDNPATSDLVSPCPASGRIVAFSSPTPSLRLCAAQGPLRAIERADASIKRVLKDLDKLVADIGKFEGLTRSAASEPWDARLRRINVKPVKLT